MKIPFLDLKAINKQHEADFRSALDRVLNSGWFIQGQELEAFESEFANYCDVEHCIGVGNGLDAIHLLLSAYSIGPGDEVIVPSNTFIATWLAVTKCGATPVPVDVDPLTYNMNPEILESVISQKTSAIIPVHLYGLPADMDAITKIAEKHKLLVIEDAAQSQGAVYKGRKVGGIGHSAATSFYPGKNLGALGDGGAVLTNDSVIANLVRQLRNYGSTNKYHHELHGSNSRLDELQAAFLRIKLQGLDSANERRIEIARRYSAGLSRTPLILPHVPEWTKPVWHLYVVRTTERERLQKYLSEFGIQTLVHYPIPPHLQKCYTQDYISSYPLSERLASEVLSLPISPVLEDQQVDEVISRILTFTF